eukprot:CAMPEP_0206143154 /NCGR_PEP_ID=MMETSP1473-20131121/19491_1 /ASSEMBLY_ACC=CAM_ASM_001109 /TAXON_ID=1461547 /ORGANISM="Stichococcus sp, Strain RCC1054" /LENGTH=374 /DNA_ID=CAMNT_0053538439 /DNA_START=322 /DNA_END=1443 /DNA_ORIENTATION=-
MPDGDLQVHPDKLDFTAAVGTDAPVTLTLFNPHPAERLAFKIKTTASSTYRVWPNSGALEPGETARVQVLLLGTKVDLSDPQCLDNISHDRFQVQFMPLAEGQEFDNGLFKLYAGLVRDIKMTVSLEVVEDLDAAQPALEETSPWEGMVRIALMRMMADEERDPASNAACLTKFSELLVLNGIITTEQMWGAFSLVGDMYQTSGEGQKVMSKVEQWLDHPDLLAVVDPDQASDRIRGSDGGSQALDFAEEGHEALHTPHLGGEARPSARRGVGPSAGEEYPESHTTLQSGSASEGNGTEPSELGEGPDGTPSAAIGRSRGTSKANGTFARATRGIPAAAGQGDFGSAHSSGSGTRSQSVSNAEDVSLGNSADRL